MELQEWELKELEKIREKKRREEDLENVYFKTTDKAERKAILERMNQKDPDSKRVSLINELFTHRYISREKRPKDIDYGIRGLMNIRFLPDSQKGLFSRSKFPEKVNYLMNDLGKDICDKYPDIGREIWLRELENIVRLYVTLCQDDKAYNSVVLGLGHMSKEKLANKIARDLVTITYAVPKSIDRLALFEPLAQAAKNVYAEFYPKKALIYEHYLDEADGKPVPKQ